VFFHCATVSLPHYQWQDSNNLPQNNEWSVLPLCHCDCKPGDNLFYLMSQLWVPTLSIRILSQVFYQCATVFLSPSPIISSGNIQTLILRTESSVLPLCHCGQGKHSSFYQNFPIYYRKSFIPLDRGVFSLASLISLVQCYKTFTV
jgi:hypothetical protein